MKTPWVNIALLGLLLLQFVTGYAGFTNGRPPNAWLLWAHGIGAYALIVLMAFKGFIIADAWRRKKRWTGERRAYVVLFVLLLLTTALGLSWTFGGPRYLAGFSYVSLHIYVAIPVMLLMGWHAWKMRFVWRVSGATGRRLFLGMALSAAAGLLLWRAGDRAKALAGWPGATRRFTGSYETGSYVAQFPAVSWIADRPPPVDLEAWQLRVEGAVASRRAYSYQSLATRPPVEVVAVLDCTGGWYTEQVWRGVAVGDLLAEAGLLASAASVTFESVTGFKRRFSLDEADRFLLGLGYVVDGRFQPLTHGHGYPLRLVAPGRRGMEWVKWLRAIRVNESGPHLQSPLPLQ
jgi:DMSO/TMAO reductase YedYZ molybdopterin-dependent catalytic subunit